MVNNQLKYKKIILLFMALLCVAFAGVILFRLIASLNSPNKTNSPCFKDEVLAVDEINSYIKTCENNNFYQQYPPGLLIPKEHSNAYCLLSNNDKCVAYYVAEFGDPYNCITEGDCVFEIDSEETYKQFIASQFSNLSYKVFVSNDDIHYTYKHATSFCVPYNDPQYRLFYADDLGKAGSEACKAFIDDMNRLGYENKTTEVALALAGVDVVAGSSLLSAEVKLMADITVNMVAGSSSEDKEQMRCFNAVFDGQGHTITFKGADAYSTFGTDEFEGFSIDINHYSPFCSFLGPKGVIKNVRLDYSGLNQFLIPNNLSGEVYCGGIVGVNLGEITSCIVTSPIVTSAKSKNEVNYGALVGYNKGSCQHCIVEGTYTIRAPGYIWARTGVKAYWGAANGTQVEYCLFTATVVEVEGKPNDILSPKDVSNSEDPYSYVNHESRANCCDYTNLYSGDYKCLSLISSAGGSYNDVGNYWYYCEDYDVHKFTHNRTGSHPYLRAFMSWKDIYFEVANTAHGSVSPNSIKIPNDATINGNRGAYNTVEIYGQSVTATPKDSYRVTSWAWNGSTNTFKVNFSTRLICVKIGKNTFPGAEDKYSIEGSLKCDTTYVVPYGAVLDVKLEKYSKNYIKSITYSFGSTVFEYTWTSAGSAQLNPVSSASTPFIKFEVDLDYYFAYGSASAKYESITIDNTNFTQLGKDIETSPYIWKSGDGYKEGCLITSCPSVGLRTYNVTIKPM